jgi:hypothetical protein
MAAIALPCTHSRHFLPWLHPKVRPTSLSGVSGVWLVLCRWPLQDFTKLMDVQFLDNLRRGASINYADMQRNPVPKTLQVR